MESFKRNSKKGEVKYCPDPSEGQGPEIMEETQKIMEVERKGHAPQVV